jgi:uncharacterized protein YijF (DUF1287 family)
MKISRRGFVLGVCAPPSAWAQSRDEFGARLAAAARAQIGITLYYDPAYARLSYPLGDVATDRGVCTDVVIRAYRALGVDLQALVHLDMRAHFSAYPKLWGLMRTDRNIDHRRVPNLETYLRRQGAQLPHSSNPADYLAGDIISWRLTESGLAHIGIVSDRRLARFQSTSSRQALRPSAQNQELRPLSDEKPGPTFSESGLANGRPLIIHNIGAGAREEDILFAHPIVGHFRWAPG